MANTKENNFIEMASQQFVGFGHGRNGYSVKGLVQSMGLKLEEWRVLKKKFKNS